jgi:hypothetical protein
VAVGTPNGEEFLLQLRWRGRFGNRLFQYAYGATYARVNGVPFYLTAPWEGTRLFTHQPHPVVPDAEIREALSAGEEKDRDADKLRVVQSIYPAAVQMDVESAPDPYVKPGHPICHANGCTYNDRVFPKISRRHLKELCEFSDEVTRLDVYKRYEDMQGLYDVAHLRRDDISDAEYNRVNPQGYSVVSQASYRRAFARFGYSPDDVIWVSDDYTGAWHVDRKMRRRGGWSYPEGSEYLPGVVFDWLDDFLKLYFARTIFRANSSFSWWAATLSPTAQVFSPVIDKRHIYGVDGMEEIDVEFVEGNGPHWLPHWVRGTPAKREIVIGE